MFDITFTSKNWEWQMANENDVALTIVAPLALLFEDRKVHYGRLYFSVMICLKGAWRYV